MKYKVEVTRFDTYEIEVNPDHINEAWFKEFREHFYDFDTPEEVAEHLAQFQARFGEHSGGFIEGFGYVTRNGSLAFDFSDYDKDGNFKPEDERRKAAPGLDIKVIEEDSDIKVEVTELQTV